MARRAEKTDWSASVEAIVRRAPKSGLGPESLGAQIRLLALLGSAAPLNVLLEGLAHYVETWADGMLCSVMLADAEAGLLRPAAAPSLHGDYVKAIDPVPIGDGRGSCGTAAARRQLVVVEDVEQSPLWAGFAPIAVGHDLRACWSMPVFDADQALLATLAIYYRTPRKPSPAELELIQFAALLAAFVIQRHRDQERLRASEARLGAAVWGTEIGLWEYFADGTCRWFDDWSKRFGVDPHLGSDAMGAWRKLIHPDDIERYNASDLQCQAAGTDHYAIDYRIRASDGRWRWIHERGRCTARATGGGVASYVGVCIDVDEMKSTAAALRRAEDLHSLTVEAARLPMWEYDVPSDTLHGNRHWHRAVGYELSEAAARERTETWLSSVHPDDAGKIARILEPDPNDRSGFFENELRIQQPNGEYRWLLDIARVVERGADGAPLKIVGVALDIDTRKRMEDSLRESEARLEAAVGGSDIGLWDWQVGAEVLTWLSDWPRRKGIKSSGERTTMADLLSAVHPDDRQRLIDDVELVVNTGRGAIETEYRFRSVRGHYLWLQTRARVVERDADGRARRVVGACIDVDQRRQAEEQLRTQAKILDTMNEGVVLIDPAGRIELTNPAFDRMFGREPGQHLGRPLRSLLAHGGADQSAPLEVDRLMKRFSGRSNRGDVMFRRADGSEFTGEVIAEPIGLTSGQKWLLVVQDVSERKQLEREVLDIANRERHRLGTDLHDGLGQELTGVALMLRSVSTRLGRESPAAVPQIDGIVGLVNHAIESTRAMARGLAPVTIDQGGLGSALEELTSRSRAAYGVQVRLRRALPDNLQISEDTAIHLYRITQEAISNSIRHGHAARVQVTLRARAGRLELSVSDDGVGFGEGRAQSRGMGLKIMRYRARMIGGTIEIRRRRVGGTRVKCVCQPRQRLNA
ncbi:MAG: PAS domain-containing protein [Proteobacteria bacterium]|nr:PAS domain-containing protein [Pseudomonadota bacterium]